MCTSPISLIVNYIPQELTDRELHSMFSTIGIVESCKIMRDFKTGYSYGYGFVSYLLPEDAHKAIEQFNGFQIGKKRIKVSYSRPSGEEIKNTNLYITNLPRYFTEANLDNLFGKFGKIVQKNVLRDKITGIPRGVAFVRFDKRDDAEKAIAELDGLVMGEDMGGPLRVKVAEEHGKQKAAYYLGWQAGLRNNHPPFPPGLIGLQEEKNKKLPKKFSRELTNHNYSFPRKNPCKVQTPQKSLSPEEYCPIINNFMPNHPLFPYKSLPST